MRPSVSVCIPVLNGSRTIGATIESVLAQTWTDFELVVADNASEDDTVALVRAFGDPRIRVVAHTERMPMGANWNRAVRDSATDLVKVVCSDDTLGPECLAVQVPLMADPDLALVASHFDLIDDDGVLLRSGLGLADLEGRVSSADAMRAFVHRMPDECFPSAAALFRREHFDRTTGFRDDFGYTLDIDLWLQLVAFGDFLGLDGCLAANRASTFNVSSTTSTLEKVRDVMAFNRWADAHYRSPAGSLRRRDRVAGDLRAMSSIAHRAYKRATGA
ncbi:glycosyltransferase family 2 protein [Gordonia sp. NPDC003376]